MAAQLVLSNGWMDERGVNGYIDRWVDGHGRTEGRMDT